MRKLLFILSALILTGGGLSAQSNHALKKKNPWVKSAQEWVEKMKAGEGQSVTSLFKTGSAAKDPEVLGPGPVEFNDYGVSVVPKEPTLAFNLSECDQTQTRPLVVKNITDEPLNAFLVTSATTKLKRELYDGTLYGVSVSDGYLYGCTPYDRLIYQIDLATGEPVREIYGFKMLAKAGGTMWAVGGEEYTVYALDENFNPTSFSFETPIEYPYIVADGDNILVCGEGEEEDEFRVLAYNTNGELVADYGSISISCDAPFLPYNPVTRTFWFFDDIHIGVQISNGKLEVNDFALFGVYGWFTRCAAFDETGNPYIFGQNQLIKSSSYGIFESEVTNYDLALSQKKLNLQPGQQSTINITAGSTNGSFNTGIVALNIDELLNNGSDPNTILFEREIAVNVGVGIEYEVYGDSVFSAFTGKEATGILWLKNTGCQSIFMADIGFFTDGTGFHIFQGGDPIIAPDGFYNERTLYPGDSLGARIAFSSDEAGDFDNKIGFMMLDFKEGEEPVVSVAEVGLKATAINLDIQISSNAIDTTLTECVDVLTVADTIVNNNAVPVKLATDNLLFKIHSGGEESDMKWQLKDANGKIVYEWPGEQDGYDYEEDYYANLTLPAGTYTLNLISGAEFGWNGGYIDMTANGKQLLSKAAHYGAYYPAPEPFTFNLDEGWGITIAANSSIKSFSVPASALNFGLTEINVFVDGLNESVDKIVLNVSGGNAELAVADSLDFGEQVKGTYTEKKLTLTNTGCAPVYFDGQIELKAWNGRNYSFEIFNEEQYENKPYASYIDSIAPGSSVSLRVSFHVDSVGQFVDTLIIPTDGLGNIEVILTGTGVGAPVAEYDDNTIKDTVEYGTPSVTHSLMVHNVGAGNLVINEPIGINYNAGSGNGEIGINIYGVESERWYGPDSWTISSIIDYSDCSEPGEYKLCLNSYDDVSDSDAYLSIISGNDTIVGKIMLKDICIAANREHIGWYDYYVYKFTLTEESFKKDTVAPGDSIQLSMTILTADLPVRSQYFSKRFTTNVPGDNSLYLSAEICVTGSTQVSAPETLDFGSVQVGTYAEQTLSVLNTGGTVFELGYRLSDGADTVISVDNQNTGYSYHGYESVLSIRFTPTTATAFAGQIFIVDNNAGDTIATVALTATGIAASELQFSADTIRLTAECGQTEIKDTITVTNSSAAAVQIAALPVLKVYTGKGDNPDGLAVLIFDKHWNSQIARYSYGTYTKSDTAYEHILDLPAGNYAIELYGRDYNYGNDGGYLSLTLNGKELLYNPEDGNWGSDYYFTIPEKTEMEIPANGSKEIELAYNLKGLAGGEYTITAVYEHLNSLEPKIDTVVAIVTIESKTEVTYNKESVEFVPVHVGESGYASLYLENTGCEVVEIDGWDMLDGTVFEVSFASRGGMLHNPEDLILKSGKKVPFYFTFKADEAGTYRDTLLIVTTLGIDTIPVVATANTTQVMTVSTPTVDGSYRVGETITINVTFDDVIVLDSTNANGLPQLLMNTGNYAVLDTTNSDGYTLTFRYAIAATDNVEALEISDIEWNGVVVVDVASSDTISVAALPANSEFVATAITLDNIAPTFQITASATETTAATATLTIAFNEEVTGFAQSDITLSEGAEISSFTTADNATFVAELSLPHAAVTNISVAASVADAAGNELAVAWTGSIASVHDFDTTIVEPTFDNVGYKKLVCKICGEIIYIDTVPVLKLESIALTSLPAKLNYTFGEAIDLTGAQLTLTFNNGTTRVIDLTLAMISGFDITATGKQTITVTYVENGETFTTTFDIEIERGAAVSEEAVAEVSIYAFESTIVVEAEADGSEIAVFDLNGRMVAKVLATSNRTEIEMPTAGVYVVRIGNTAERVAVK